MVHYKLTYFDGRGSAEIIRYIFAISGDEYEDVRYSMDEWPSHKEEMPFHQIPVLEVDGKQLAQCHAICRFLARQFGLAGKSDFDAAMVDAITDQCKDFYIETTPYFRVAFGAIKGDKDDLKKSLFLPSREKLFTYLTKILKNNKSGYFVGDSLTWADLYLACMADHAETVPEFYDGFPEMKAHSDRIRSIPALKEWIETRPKTAF